MNIEQIKSDLDAGIMVSLATMVRLVEAALMMQQVMQHVSLATSDEQAGDALDETLTEVGVM